MTCYLCTCFDVFRFYYFPISNEGLFVTMRELHLLYSNILCRYMFIARSYHETDDTLSYRTRLAKGTYVAGELPQRLPTEKNWHMIPSHAPQLGPMTMIVGASSGEDFAQICISRRTFCFIRCTADNSFTTIMTTSIDEIDSWSDSSRTSRVSSEFELSKDSFDNAYSSNSSWR